MISDYTRSDSVKKSLAGVLIAFIFFIVFLSFFSLLLSPLTTSFTHTPHLTVESAPSNLNNTTDSVVRYDSLSESQQSILRKAIAADINSREGILVENNWTASNYVQLDGTTYKVTSSLEINVLRKLLVIVSQLISSAVIAASLLSVLLSVDAVVNYMKENFSKKIQIGVYINIALVAILTSYILLTSFAAPVFEKQQVIEKPIENTPTSGDVISTSNLSKEQKERFYTAITKNERTYTALEKQENEIVYIKSDGEFYELKHEKTFESIVVGLAKVLLLAGLISLTLLVSIFFVLSGRELYSKRNLNNETT